MPQSGDFLQSLLQGDLGEGAGPYGNDRQAAIDAIVQHIRAQNDAGMNVSDPVAVPRPAYGPIDKLGQVLGIAPKFQPVSPQLSNQMWLGGQVAQRGRTQDQEDKLDEILKTSEELGTDAGRAVGRTLGAPELAEDIPAGVRGMGELRGTAQDLKYQQMLNSSEAKQQELAYKYFASEMRGAAAENNAQRLNTLARVTQERAAVATEKQENAPINQLVQDTMGDLRAEENHLLSIQAQLAGGTSSTPEQLKSIQDQLDDVKRRRRSLLRGREKIKTGADLDKLLYEDKDTSPAPPPPAGGVKPPPKGLFD